MATSGNARVEHGRLYLAGSLVLALGLANPVAAAEQWHITPAVGVRGTLTDNVGLAPDNAKQSDFVTELIPSIRIDGEGPRLKLSLAYQLDGIVYAREPGRSEVQHDLKATGTLTAIENFFFVDVSGNISQQVLSPLGARPSSGISFTSNRVESRAFQVSPYVRGHLAVGADYTVRFSESWLQAERSAENARVHEFSARVNGDESYTRLNWALEANAQKTDFQIGRDTDQQRIRALLTYAIQQGLHVTGTVGLERTNISTLDHEQKPTYGGGLEWKPDPRTEVNGMWERRFFGDSWQYGIRHRTPFLVLSISDSQDVTNDAQRLLTSGSGIAYDLLYNYLTSRFPDPAQRAVEARRLLDTGGIPSDLNLPPDFLVGGVFLDRRLQAGIAVSGVRNTAMLSLYKSRREQLGGFTALPGASGSGNVNEYGTTIALSHALTPITSLTAMGSWRRTTDLSGSGLSSRQWEAHLLYATRFGPNTAGSVELRHVRFGSDVTGNGDYTENAITVAVLYQF